MVLWRKHVGTHLLQNWLCYVGYVGYVNRKFQQFLMLWLVCTRSLKTSTKVLEKSLNFHSHPLQEHPGLIKGTLYPWIYYNLCRNDSELLEVIKMKKCNILISRQWELVEEFGICNIVDLSLFLQIWPLPLFYLGNLVTGLGGTQKLRYVFDVIHNRHSEFW